MSIIAHKHKQITRKQIVDMFHHQNISLHPAGIWKWDENRKKTAIDAQRKDGLALSSHPKDNIFKHRIELSGTACLDCDGIPLHLADQWFPSSAGSLYTTTSSFGKQHRYLAPPKGKTFPESRAIKDAHKDLDIITFGIVFEAHDYLSKDSQFTMNNTEIKRCTTDEYDRICEILTPKGKTKDGKALKQTKFADNKNKIIDKFNKKFSCEELLMAQGYLNMGYRMIHPESESGMAGIIFFDDGCVYSHSSDWLNDGSSHDAFDIYAHYEYDGDKGIAMAGARDLLNLNYYGFERSEKIIDYKRLGYIKSQIGYSTKDRYFYMLTPRGKLIQAGAKDLWEFVARTFPPAFGWELIEDEARKMIEEGIEALDPNLSEKDKDKAIKDIEKNALIFTDNKKANISSVMAKTVYDLKYDNTFEMMEYSINPFADESTIKITGSVMRVEVNTLFPNLDMSSIKHDYKNAMLVYKDFKNHFPEIPLIIEMIIASRFGADRKKAFLYTQMASDFGKSFLSAVFGRLGLLVNIKEKELKKAFSGDPVAMDATEFQTAWILFFDEFKQAVNELKDITHHLTLSPKNQMRQKVQLYTKWTASKESSQSLVGNGGVDDQFANRFSMIDTGTKKLTDRKMYNKDQNTYFDALTYAVYVIIKKKSDDYIAMGETKAGIEANKVMDKFRSKYAMKATLSVNAELLVEEMIDYLKIKLTDDDFVPSDPDIKDLETLAKYVFTMHNKVIYLQRVDILGRFFEEFAKKTYGEKHYHKISYQKDALRGRFGDRKHRTAVSIGGKKINVYPLLNKDGTVFNPKIDEN